MHALNNNSQIYTAIKKQLKKNKYTPQYIYGNGNASQKIIPIILNAKISIQKKITY
jgi:UDP-N-acetylglucosamine 2-epimerase